MPGNAYSLCVQDVMSRDVVAADTGTTVHEAIQLMTENGISALPVLNHRYECVGIISTTDLIDLAQNIDEDLESYSDATEGGNWLIGKLIDSFGHENVSSVMSERPLTVRPEATLVSAAESMLQEHVHRLPVVDDSQKLVGILSTMDILKAFAAGESGG